MIGVTRQASVQGSKLVVVEGNIGAGKTTLAVEVARRMNAKAILEPIAENPYLAKFYSDPKKYALKLQLWIFRRRLQLYTEALDHIQQGQTVILDRSVFGDSVFAEVGYMDENISDEEYDSYKQLRQKTLKILPSPDVLVFLDAPPSCCHNRIISRGRECERGIPIDYLAKLDQSYRKFVDDMRLHSTRVAAFDWEDFGSVTEVIQVISTAPKQSTGKLAMDAYQKCLKRLSTLGISLWTFVSQGLEISESENSAPPAKRKYSVDLEERFFYQESPQQSE